MNLYFENKNGEQISLTNNDYFYLTNIDGQTTATSTVNSYVNGGMDGDTVTSMSVHPRTITLDLRVKSSSDVQECKNVVTRCFKIKQRGTLVWTQNEKTVKIDGFVENIEMPRWNNSVTMQITLHCEQPFWEDIADVIQEISEAIDMHYFTDIEGEMLWFPSTGIPLGLYDSTRTKEFQNDGDVEVGMEIELDALDTVTNPIIRNSEGDFFGIGNGTGARQVVLSAGDVVKINTKKGQKKITINGVSAYDKIKPSSTWLQLQPGQNTLTINSDDESTSNMRFNINYKQRYI